MKSLRLSLITSLCASYVVKPPLVAFPTLWDCSRRESEAAERDELLLVEEEPICLATLSPEVLVDEEALLSEEELLTEDDELRDDDELLTDDLHVIATGGLADTILPLCETSIRYVPDLTLEGLRILYYKNIFK